MTKIPTLYLIGGANGAGKTTFAKEYLPNELNCLRFYNSDEIAMGLSPFDPSLAQFQAGKILLRNIQESLQNRDTFALESTLSGKSYANYLRKAKEQGYRIVLHFLWLPSVNESWQRVEARVSEGGHSVPEDAVKRRYPKVLKNFFEIYAPLSDEWNFWDASKVPIDFIGYSGKTTLKQLQDKYGD